MEKEETLFYINFVKAILPKNIFKFKTSKDKHIIFVLDCTNIIGSQKILQFLSLFRYINEFPECLKDFYKNRSKNLMENFIIFQKSHLVDFIKYPHGKSIHAVTENYKNFISLKTYKSRLKQETLPKVMDYFAKE